MGGGRDANARFGIGGGLLPLGIRARGGAAMAGPGGSANRALFSSFSMITVSSPRATETVDC